MGLLARIQVWRMKRRYQEKADLFGQGEAFRAELTKTKPTTPEAVKAAYIAAFEAAPVVIVPLPPVPGDSGFLRLVGGGKDG